MPDNDSVSGMNDTTKPPIVEQREPEKWEAAGETLLRILQGKRPEDLPQEAMIELIGSSLISREEQTAPCRTCGTPRPDFSYWRVTAAGRLLASAYQSIRKAQS